MSDLTRREAIAGSGAALTLAMLGAGTAQAARSDENEPHVVVLPVTPDRVAVVARVHSGEVLTASQGSERRSRTAEKNVAVLGLAVAKSARSRVVVEVAGASRTLDVDTRVEALRASELRVVNKRVALTNKDKPKKLATAGAVVVDARLQHPIKRMIKAAKKDKVDLEAVSGYRSFEYQESLYARYERRDGRKAADTYSARAGHSEHQLGLTIDVRGADAVHELEESFKDTPTGKWVAAHAHEFGFVVRYQDGQEKTTGYRSEPWHLRYVGDDVARFLHQRRDIKTLEELFDLPAAPGY